MLILVCMDEVTEPFDKMTKQQTSTLYCHKKRKVRPYK